METINIIVVIIRRVSDKKYIFFDIDGTILPANGVVPESTKKALKLAQQNGHEIFLNTGRCRPIVPQKLLDLNFDGLVCGTGTYAEYNGEVVFRNVFTESQAKKVLDFSIKYDVPIIMSTNNECVATATDTAKYIVLFTDGEFDPSDFKSAKDLEKSPLLDSMRPYVIDEDKKNYLKNFKEISDFVYIESPFSVDEVNQILGDDLNAERASFKNPDDFSGEITLSKFNKSTGIKDILTKIGGDLKDSIAVGDGYNDIEMLKGAASSIAMGNSPDDVKDIADYVTDDINSDGVYNALKHFKII